MNPISPMPRDYLALAELRARTPCQPHKQPEEFGYDFHDWVSPYTKGSHSFGGIALVLQDWASDKGLDGGLKPDIQLHGRAPDLLTNVRLEKLLNRVLGIGLAQVYATNAFPFVKSGSMSAKVRLTEVVDTVRRFAAKEIQLVQPKVVLALGRLPYIALCRAGVECIYLPHPAARIGAVDKHEAVWRSALSSARVALPSA